MSLSAFFKRGGEGGRVRFFLQPNVKLDYRSAVFLFYSLHLLPARGIGRQEGTAAC